MGVATFGDMTVSHERVRDYFRVKSRQLRASADLAVCDHNGLSGNHREELQRIYFNEVLPRRFEVGSGMVYGQFHRSREADIVIWNFKDYPSLPMSDHAFFFAESVRMVLESKSQMSSAEFDNDLLKSQAVSRLHLGQISMIRLPCCN